MWKTNSAGEGQSVHKTWIKSEKKSSFPTIHSWLFENKKRWQNTFLCMKEKLLSVGKFVIIEYIVKMTDTFDLGWFFCCFWFFLIEYMSNLNHVWIYIKLECGVWVLSVHSRSFYSYQWSINFMFADLLTLSWSHLGRCNFCASFICDGVVTFETAKIESGSNSLKRSLFTTFCKLNKWIFFFAGCFIVLELGQCS